MKARPEPSSPSTGRIALVTGASRGVGAATARAFADRGADVIVNYRSKELRAEEVVGDVRRAGRRALAARADLTDPDESAAMFDLVRERFGRLDFSSSTRAVVWRGTGTRTTPCE